MPPTTKSAFLASLTAAIPGECPICYQPMASPYKTPCNHTFCRECATAWFEQSACCPTCRTTLYSPPLSPEAEYLLLPEVTTIEDLENALPFLPRVVRRLYDDNKWNEGSIEELKKEVDEWRTLALAAGKRLQELTELVKMYKEQEEAWEEMEEVLRRKIGLLKGRINDDEAEELAKVVEKKLRLTGEEARGEDGDEVDNEGKA